MENSDNQPIISPSVAGAKQKAKPYRNLFYELNTCKTVEKITENISRKFCKVLCGCWIPEKKDTLIKLAETSRYICHATRKNMSELIM